MFVLACKFFMCDDDEDHFLIPVIEIYNNNTRRRNNDTLKLGRMYKSLNSPIHNSAPTVSLMEKSQHATNTQYLSV